VVLTANGDDGIREMLLQQPATVYDLQGRLTGQQTAPGIYIRQGKKYIVK